MLNVGSMEIVNFRNTEDKRQNWRATRNKIPIYSYVTIAQKGRES